MPSYRKQIAFDLDTKKLKKYYSSISKAYKDIQSIMIEFDFIHRQGSVYNSKNPIPEAEIPFLVDNISKRLPWLGDCIKEIDVSNIDKIHSIKIDFVT